MRGSRACAASAPAPRNGRAARAAFSGARQFSRSATISATSGSLAVRTRRRSMNVSAIRQASSWRASSRGPADDGVQDSARQLLDRGRDRGVAEHRQAQAMAQRVACNPCLALRRLRTGARARIEPVGVPPAGGHAAFWPAARTPWCLGRGVVWIVHLGFHLCYRGLSVDLFMIYPYPDCGSPQERNRFPFHGAPIQAKERLRCARSGSRDRDRQRRTRFFGIRHPSRCWHTNGRWGAGLSGRCKALPQPRGRSTV
jgi:hypothetical protein